MRASRPEWEDRANVQATLPELRLIAFGRKSGANQLAPEPPRGTPVTLMCHRYGAYKTLVRQDTGRNALVWSWEQGRRPFVPVGPGHSELHDCADDRWEGIGELFLQALAEGRQMALTSPLRLISRWTRL